jgi:hypothetical protein
MPPLELIAIGVFIAALVRRRVYGPKPASDDVDLWAVIFILVFITALVYVRKPSG